MWPGLGSRTSRAAVFGPVAGGIIPPLPIPQQLSPPLSPGDPRREWYDNPDARLRETERAAKAGDRDAQFRLYHERQRRFGDRAGTEYDYDNYENYDVVVPPLPAPARALGLDDVDTTNLAWDGEYVCHRTAAFDKAGYQRLFLRAIPGGFLVSNLCADYKIVRPEDHPWSSLLDAGRHEWSESWVMRGRDVDFVAVWRPVKGKWKQVSIDYDPEGREGSAGFIFQPPTKAMKATIQERVNAAARGVLSDPEAMRGLQLGALIEINEAMEGHERRLRSFHREVERRHGYLAELTMDELGMEEWPREIPQKKKRKGKGKRKAKKKVKKKVRRGAKKVSNPDEDLRRLERAAAEGDAHAEVRLLERMSRAGQLPVLRQPVYLRLLSPGVTTHPSGQGLMELPEVSVSFSAASAMEFVENGAPLFDELQARYQQQTKAPLLMISLEVLDQDGVWNIVESERDMRQGVQHSTLFIYSPETKDALLWSARKAWPAAVRTAGGHGRPCPCPSPDVVTCGNCERSWCDRCDPAHGPLCPFCHGRGESDHEVFPNPDESLRRLGRAASRGDHRATVDMIRAKLRAGQLILPQVALAAAVGDAAALEVLDSERPDFGDWIRRNDYQALMVLRPQFLGPATGNGKYIGLGAQFSIRALAAVLRVFARRGVLDASLKGLPGDAMRWLSAPPGETEELGEQIADRYLDILEAMPQRTLRLRPDQPRHAERLEVASSPASEVAHHLTHAISMSSGGYRTRWKWGFATDRATDALRATFRGCRFELGDKGECIREIEDEIRRATVPWLIHS
jgi:hypothetical protein